MLLRAVLLLVTWAQNEESTSGLGESMATKRVYRLTPNP